MIALARKHPYWVLGVIVFSLVTKWVLIHFGYPFPTHVDETTILKDPLRWLVVYAQGDLSKPTNLLNWLYLVWTGILFVGGLLVGQWHNVQEFQQYLFSEDISYIIHGRLLSVLLSTLGNVVFTLLVFRMTEDRFRRIALVLLFVLNPFELNANNFIKFDPISYLFYALILYYGHGYFIRGEQGARRALYLCIFAGLSARIEIVGFLFGATFTDLFGPLGPLGRTSTLRNRIGGLVRPYLTGIGVYLLITLAPVAFLYNHFGPAPDGPSIMGTSSFQEVILGHMPRDRAALMTTLMHCGGHYLGCAFALSGPALILLALFSLRERKLRFLHGSAALILVVLLLNGVANTFYFLSISVIMIFLAGMVAEQDRWRSLNKVLLWISLLWSGSFTLSFLWTMLHTGDLRVPATAYLLEHTRPSDMIYVDGMFTGIPNSPATYRALSEATQEVGGSTGLVSLYRAEHLDTAVTRHVMGVQDYDFFLGTRFEGWFNNWHDTAQLVREDPVYYVFVLPDYWREQDLLDGKLFTEPRHHPAFYRYLREHFHLERAFSYHPWDPRLRYRNFYYFHSTLILRRNTDR